MKSLPTQILLFINHRSQRRNVWTLVRFMLVLTVMVLVYSVAFHYIEVYEREEFGQEKPHSWFTGFYWTLTVMSTLGFGDITFESNLGRAFSVLVLLSGVLFLLILLPFTFIQFFYQPWMEARDAARAPEELPESTRDHVVLIRHDPVTMSLIERMRNLGQEYVLIVPEREEALRLTDQDIRVMVGDLGDPATYRNVRLEQARMLVASGSDELNTRVTIIARDLAPDVPIAVTSNAHRSQAILKVAGATNVLPLGQLMGESLARRTTGGDALTHVVDSIGTFHVAEANAIRTPLVGKTLAENKLSEFGVVVLCVWERGTVTAAGPDTVISENAVLVLGGTREQLDAYDEGFVIYNVSGEPVVLIGGGSVGQATAKALTDRGIEWRMIEIDPEHRPLRVESDHFIVGDAADEKTLLRAGIDDAPAVIITPENDELNIYLTIMLRTMRPDIQIVTRAVAEQSVHTLHKAGADFVMSTASLGASRLTNLLRRDSIVTVAEGLSIWRVALPRSLAGRKLIETTVRGETGASVVAVIPAAEAGTVGTEAMLVNPDPTVPLPVHGELLLMGDKQAERLFKEKFADDD